MFYEESMLENTWLYGSKIAHKGLHNERYPENSLGAIQNAIDHGYPFEIDVYMISDGTIAVMHEFNLKHMCGVNVDIRTLKKEDLKKYHLLGTEYTIPTLEEVLELTKGQVPIMVELKSFAVFSVGKFEQKVYDIMKHYDGQYAIQAFNPLTINWFKKNAPEVIRGQLWCLFEDVAELPRFAKHILRKMYLTRRSRPDFLAYSTEDISKKFLKKFKKTPKLGWVIHSEKQEEQANEIFSGVIFEDYLPDSTESKKA